MSRPIQPAMVLSRTSTFILFATLLGCAVRGFMFSGNMTSEELPERPAEVQFQVDLNRADAIELSLLPDVGPVLAERIVEYREAQGPISTARELLNVAGIGEKTLSTIEPFLYVAPAEGGPG